MFAAVTALTSWASVRRSQKNAQEQRHPDLQVTVEQIEGSESDGVADTIVLILNAGMGTATSVFCIAKVGNEYFANPVGHGFLLYQQKAIFKAKMQKTKDCKALLVCRDLDGTVWASDEAGLSKRYDGKAIDPKIDSKQLWTDFYTSKLDGKSVATELSIYEVGS